MDNIIRVQKDKNNPYVMVNKGYLEDKEISFKAKGLLTYLLSRPDDWKVYISHLKKISTDGRDSVGNAIKELMKKGYITRSETPKSKGKYTGYKYTVFESPKNRNGLTATEKPTTDKPNAENPILLSNDLLNNDNTNIIFNYWNNKKITVHKNLTSDMIKKIVKYLKDYSIDDIKNAIDNYDIILKEPKYIWTKKWGLIDFLSRGLYRFTDESKPLESYINFNDGGNNGTTGRNNGQNQLPGEPERTDQEVAAKYSKKHAHC
jgi:hypothetical protein